MTTSPDLSSVGVERKADWMAKYLLEAEAIKGEKNGSKFRGSNAKQSPRGGTWRAAFYVSS